MKISIVTPCFNAQKYIRETVNSVLQQDYEELQYMVLDGGSTDGTKDYLGSLKDTRLSYVSEADDGQYSAIQRGLNQARGEVLAWINGDDIYLPWTLKQVAAIFKKFDNVDWIIGQPCFIGGDSTLKLVSDSVPSYPDEFIKNGWFRPGGFGYLMQEGMFWRKSLWEKAGGFNLEYKYAADYDLWTRFAQYAQPVAVAFPLSCFRVHAESRSKVGQYYSDEVKQIAGRLPRVPFHYRTIGNYGQKGTLVNALSCFRKSPMIYGSLHSSELKMNVNYRNLSKYSVRRLLLEKRQ